MNTNNRSSSFFLATWNGYLESLVSTIQSLPKVFDSLEVIYDGIERGLTGIPDERLFHAFDSSIHAEPTISMVMMDVIIIAILPNTSMEYEAMNARMTDICKAVHREALVS